MKYFKQGYRNKSEALPVPGYEAEEPLADHCLPWMDCLGSEDTSLLQ